MIILYNYINMNPLTYSSVNNMLSPIQTSKLKKTLTGVTTNEQLNQILNDTTIKRGCCMRKNNNDKIYVKVKIPKPKGHVIEVHDSAENKFNYIEKLVEISPHMCDEKYSYYKNGTSQCDDFFQSYCTNILSDYEELVNGQFNPTEWAEYSPECSCYGKSSEESAPGIFNNINIPPKCYMPGCGGSTSYLDPISRKNECNLTICNALFNASDFEAGKNISVQSKVEQNCGHITSETTKNNMDEHIQDVKNTNKDENNTNKDENNTNKDENNINKYENNDMSDDTNITSNEKNHTKDNIDENTNIEHEQPNVFIPSGKKSEEIHNISGETTDSLLNKSNLELYLGLGAGVIALIIIGVIIYKIAK
jgi:hypothetical protein